MDREFLVGVDRELIIGRTVGREFLVEMDKDSWWRCIGDSW